MPEIKRTATCCCGGLVLETEGEPYLSVICHCADCRSRSGSAFGWSAYFPEASVRIVKGEPGTYQPAGEGALPRHHCQDCASTLLWRDHRFPGHIGVAAGALQPPVEQPQMSNQDTGRSRWIALPAGCIARP